MFYYFRNGQFCRLRKRVDRAFRMGDEQMQCLTDWDFWEENKEWKEIISTYLQIQSQTASKEEQGKVSAKVSKYS